jgi:hypothetical protein
MTGVPLEAVIVEFDAAVGWGSVQVLSTGEVLGFHCLDIADATRTIEVDTPVNCRRVGRLGHWEAAAITRR